MAPQNTYCVTQLKFLLYHIIQYYNIIYYINMKVILLFISQALIFKFLGWLLWLERLDPESIESDFECREPENKKTDLNHLGLD